MSFSAVKHWWQQPHNFVLTLILALGIFLRFYNLSYPSGYYFDEVYHVPTARAIAKGDPRAYEWWHGELKDERQAGTYIDWLHPPLAKLLQAGTIIIFGDREFGWRAASAAAGSLLVLVVYLLARASLSPKQKNFALLAAFLIAIDGLAIAQSRIAMNDIFVTLFMTLGVFFYLRHLQQQNQLHWLILLALACGASIASKWSGVFLIGFIGLWELSQSLGHWRQLLTSTLMLVFLISASAFFYLLAYGQMFSQHNYAHFIELHNQIIRYQIGLDASHPFASAAWEWPLGTKPVYLYYDDVTKQEIWNRPFYPSWFFALATLVLALSLLLLDPIYRRHNYNCQPNHEVSPFFTTTAWGRLFFITLAYFCFWAPWLASPRIMFFYHYLPAVPLITIVAAMTTASLFRANHAIIKAKKRKGQR
jgi:dolichyl-phosphate-mannose--protein O-mannosyl transferase